MNIEEAKNYITKTAPKGSVLGLSRITELMEKLGNPQDDLKFIHVAGTNGKGSTCRFLASILEKAGYRVGLFTSPYIEVYNERIQVNSENIPDEDLAQIVSLIAPVADSMEDSPTEFELNSAIAFVYFKKAACDIVVLEVGLGGEFDSTNIIKPPVAAVITSIGLDHTKILGDTKEMIAGTKSKIIKPGTAAIVYKQENSVMDVIRERCAQVGAELFVSEPEAVEFEGADLYKQQFAYKDFGVLSMLLLGRYQLNNAALVLKIVEVLRTRGYSIPNSAVFHGFSETKWPGRFEVISREPIVIVDGSHNPDGIKAAAEGLKALFPDEKITFIFGVLADKDYEEMLDTIAPLAAEILAVAPESPRALPATWLCELVKQRGIETASFSDFRSAAKTALDHVYGVGVICALGSLYMVADIKKAFRELR